MAITVGIIQGKAPDGSGNGGVTEAQLSAPIVDFISPGAKDATSFRVDPPGTSVRQVVIKAGRYYAPNATGTMVYVVDLDADYSLSLATNGAGNPRISAITLKIDKGTAPNIYANNVASFIEVQGTAAGSPVAPNDAALQSGVGAGNVAVRLADVTLSAGYTTVTSPNIADKRSTAGLPGSLLVPGSVSNASLKAGTDEPGGAWIDGSGLSMTGWASFTGKVVRYKKIGRTVNMAVYIAGTSNSTTTSMTLPYTAATTSMIWLGANVSLTNNSVASTTPGRWIINTSANANLIGFDTLASGGTWTASGTKAIVCTITYEATS